jgi:hypothetical protein
MLIRALKLTQTRLPQTASYSATRINESAPVLPIFSRHHIHTSADQYSSLAKINNAFKQLAEFPEPRADILDHIHRESDKLVEEAKQSQLRGGYNVDNWKLAPLGQTQILLQSLAFGTDSLVTLSDHSRNEFDAYLQRCEQGLLPPGTSFYFACSVALSHNYIHGNMNLEKGVKHYHEYTQVGQKYCTETGDVELAHRQYVVICQNFPEWMRRIPVAESIVAANPVQNVSMNCGNVKTVPLGDGQAKQLLVAKSLLPFIHQCSKYVFSHHKGLEKPVTENGRTVGWINNRTYHHSSRLPAIIHVKPNGEHAEPETSATATKFSR